ncbi:unnamed protein product [Polarella glacialis]|uniref:DNA 3'-5' helicase n=1 Tax=Polarella glacialis TaxID=89957 RepID=A0A813LRF4_POLGL|nr:unnamed protein product [Polarella glacialis]
MNAPILPKRLARSSSPAAVGASMAPLPGELTPTLLAQQAGYQLLRSGSDLPRQRSAAALTPFAAPQGNVRAEVVVEFTGLPKPATFTVGGAHGNAVAKSNTPNVHRGWRLIAVNGKPVAAAEVRDALALAQQRPRYSATFRSDQEAARDVSDELATLDLQRLRAAQERRGQVAEDAHLRAQELLAEAREAERQAALRRAALEAERARRAALAEAARKQRELEEWERCCMEAEDASSCEREVQDAEHARLLKEAIDAERARQAAEEAERIRREEEAAREAETAERIRIEASAAASRAEQALRAADELLRRARKAAEDAELARQAAEAAERLRLEEQARKEAEAEESARRRAAAEAEEAQLKKLDFEQQLREAEEAELLRKEAAAAAERDRLEEEEAAERLRQAEADRAAEKAAKARREKEEAEAESEEDLSTFMQDAASIRREIEQAALKRLAAAGLLEFAAVNRGLKWTLSDNLQHYKSFDGCGLPPIALACIDEAHCVSEWSHNFRPDYLRLHEFLVGSLGARRLLALTATATRPTIKSICEILKVGTVVRSDRSFTVEDLMAEASQPKVQRTNLCMNARILPDEDLQVAELIKILKSEEHSRHSVIIYVWRRATAEQLSKQLRAHVKGGIRAYHGSMLPEARRAVQEAFMTGTARVVVATVAFGMGLDKSNIRTVIHFGLPKSIENYIQETGRCSRDGAPGQCIALVSPKDYKTMRWLESGGGGGGSQASVVRKLLGMLFRPGETGPCQKHELCEDAIKVARVGLDPGPEGEDVPPANGSWKPYCVAFDEKETAQTLNCPADELHSALAHLSRHARGHMNLLSKFPTKIKLRFFGIDANELAKQDWLIRQVLPLSKKIGAVYSIDTAKALAVMGGTAGQLSSGLWGARGKEFAVEKADYGYMVSVLRPVDEAQLEAWSAEISGINARARQSAVEKLDASFIALSRAAEAAQSAGSDAAIAASKANDALTTLIDAYFSATEDPSAVVAGDGEVRRRLLSSALGQEYTTVSGHQFARVPMPQPRSGFSAGAASANSGGAPSDAQGQTKGDQPVEILQGTVVCATVARLVLSPDWPTISNQEPDAVAHAVAQFLGGMSSVVLPAKKWKEHRFWGRFRGIGDFQYLEELVKGAIVKIQGLKSARPMP